MQTRLTELLKRAFRWWCVCTIVALAGHFALAMVAVAQVATSVTVVSGTVVDASTGRVVPNADVRIVGTSFVARSQNDGHFVIQGVPVGAYNIEAHSVASGSALAQSVRLYADRRNTIVLKLSSIAPHGAGVIATGSFTPAAIHELGYGVDQLPGDNLPVPSALSAIGSLEGKVAGLTVRHSSGAPDAGLLVQLRTPLSPIDSVPPLYVVDGVVLSALYPTSELDIESLDIAHVDILKGVAASAVYGYRGMHGVIVITTRRGLDVALGAPHFSIRNEIGNDVSEGVTLAPAAHQYRVNSAGQYVDVNGNVVTRAKRVVQANGIVNNAYIDPLFDHDAQLFRAGLLSTQTIALEQNRASTNYHIDYARTQDRGTVLNVNGIVRQSMHLNLDQRWRERLSVGIAVSHTISRDNPTGTSFEALSYFDPDLDLTAPPLVGTLPYNDNPDRNTIGFANPLDDAIENQSRIDRRRTLVNMHASYRVLNWLSLDALGGYDRAYRHQLTMNDAFTDGSGNNIPARVSFLNDSVANGEFQGGATATQSWSLVNARFALRGETQREAYQNIQESYFGTNHPEVGDQPAGLSTLNLVRRTEALISSAQIDYDKKYFFDAVLRREGVSLFGERKQWTSFTRASAAWILSDEAWLPFKRFDAFKLRYSVGSAATPNGEGTFLFAPLGLTVPTPRPTTAVEREVAVDVAAGGRVQGTLAYAETHSTATPLRNGSAPNGNYVFDDVALKGHTTEITVTTKVINDFHGLRWDVSIVADRRGSVISQYAAPCSFDVNLQKTCVGEHLSQLYGYQFVRDKNNLPATVASVSDVFDVNDEGYVVPVGAGNSWRDGKAKNLWGTLVLINGTRYPWGIPIALKDSIGASSLLPIVDGYAGLPYGVQNTFRYRGFRAYGQLSGQLGGQIYNRVKQRLYAFGKHPDVNQIEKPDEAQKPLAYYRALATPSSVSTLPFVESATYARLSETSVGYVFNANRFAFLHRIGAQNIAVDLIARNLFTLKRYSGNDPQSPSLTAPLDVSRYPLSRTFSLATSIGF